MMSFAKALMEPIDAKSSFLTTTLRFAVSNTISARACSAFSKSLHARITLPPRHECQKRTVIFFKLNA